MFSSPQINQNMPQPYAMSPPSAGPLPGPYAMPVGYGGPQQYGGPPPGYGYGVQQLYPPQNSLMNVDEKFGTNSVLMPILCCGAPMLLGSIGIYCTVQGKVNNDIAFRD